MNPEFTRNIWLEISKPKLFAVPLLLICYFVLANYLGTISLLNASKLLLSVGVCLAAIKASGAILEEVRGKTWERQCASAIGPWSMTWAKLLGSTAIVWYAFLCSSPVIVFSNYNFLENIYLHITPIFLASILGPSIAIFLSLLKLNQSHESILSSQVIIAFFSILITTYICILPILNPLLLKEASIRWNSSKVNLYHVFLATTTWLIFWVLVGSYRLMHKQFNQATYPVIWAIFLSFNLFLVSKFEIPQIAIDSAYSFSLLAFIIMCQLATVTAFMVPQNINELHNWLSAIQNRNVYKVIQSIPLWLVSMMVVIGTASYHLYMAFDSRGSSDAYSLGGNISYVIAFLLYTFRDIGIIYRCQFIFDAKYPLLKASLCLTLLYTAAPWVIAKLDTSGVISLAFNPLSWLSGDFGVASKAIGMLLLVAQVAYVWISVWDKWGKIYFRKSFII